MMHIEHTGTHSNTQEHTGAHGSARERCIMSNKGHHEHLINAQTSMHLTLLEKQQGLSVGTPTPHYP